MVLIRRSRIGLVDPSSDHATICYARWRTGKANAHVNEEHVVERRAEDQPPTEVDPTKLTAHNLRIVRTLLFGTGSFRQINSERQYVPLW